MDRCSFSRLRAGCFVLAGWFRRPAPFFTPAKQLSVGGAVLRPRMWAACPVRRRCGVSGWRRVLPWVVGSGCLGLGFPGGAPATAATPSAERGEAPPEYADAAHVPEGCVISAVVYLARFHQDFPEEKGEMLTVVLPNRDTPHTIALISWRGAWWGRDEYSGVFALRLPVRGAPPAAQLSEQAGAVLSRLSGRQLRFGRIAAQTERAGELSLARRREAVATAAELLPCASRCYWVRGDGSEWPFLFFETAAGQIAVYDPAHGTAQAECALQDPAKVVTLVAVRLGYPVDAIRAESLASGALAARYPALPNPVRP